MHHLANGNRLAVPNFTDPVALFSIKLPQEPTSNLLVGDLAHAALNPTFYAEDHVPRAHPAVDGEVRLGLLALLACIWQGLDSCYSHSP